MTSDELLAGLAAAGITTQQQVTDLFAGTVLTTEIKALEAQLFKVQTERAAALQPFADQTQAINDKIKFLTDSIPTPKP